MDKDNTISVVPLLQAVAEDICSNFCKWPIIYNVGDVPLHESEICKNCPLKRLL